MDIIHGRPIDRSVMLAGQLDLSVGPYDTGPLRHIRLKHFLEVLQPTLIGFEDVKFTPDQALAGKPVGVIVARVATAAELLGGFKITLATWAEEHGIPVHGWGIGQIKKWATGRGNANKDDMIEAACKMFGVRLEMDGADNIADAMAICCMTAERYALGL
jgi:Holliday junction resolvasome RuvABC endonuclease subunit